MTIHSNGFSRERHGPWAVIAGASDGLGEEFAHHAAAAGVNCILVARRERVVHMTTHLNAFFGEG